ncbi:hypothetical protein ACFV6U_20390 [Streptomyces sp. NPDC059810]|uniref:hypothetical protein n=1 Tax=Streptomyces sp. NPDC059810 TaxID=3346956 RepID=UPI00364AF7F3
MTASGSVPLPDGGAVLSGSGRDEGDGLFRVAAAADGTPKLTKVAETGTPVFPLTIDRVGVPAVAEIDKTNGSSFTWEPIFEEQGEGSLREVDAPNGAYTVAVKATLDDGAGAPVSKSSPMSIGRAFNPHDFNDNGSMGVVTAPFNRRTTDLFKYQGSAYSSVS